MLFDKLRHIEERPNEIARALSAPAIFGRPVEYARLRKEHADTVEIVERFTAYRDVLRRIGEARHILAEGGDRELAELAQAEIDELTGRQAALEEELKRLLLPRDPNDEKNVFVEIRAGAGGDAAAPVAPRRAGRKYDGFGRANPPPAEGARRDGPGRAVADQEPGEGDARPQGAAAGARAGRAAGGHRGRPPQPGRHGRAQRADPHLQLSAGAGDRPSHRTHAPSAAGRARGRPRRAGRRARRGPGGRAAPEGRALMGPAATFGAELDAATTALEAAGLASARVEAEWLLAGLLGVGRVGVRLDLAGTLPEPLAERYAHAVRRRASREPLQRILGWEEFRGVRVRLTEAVLVPRPETETLVEWALELLRPPAAGRRVLAIDVGTGSGCIACALAAERSDLDVVAIDVSPAAAAVARENVRALQLSARIRVVVADLLDGISDPGADLIVSNPPYLPTALVPELPPEVRTHDPMLALDGGADGLALIRRIAAVARRGLRSSGVLVVETAGAAQAAATAALFQAAGFAQGAVRADLPRLDRFVAGRA